MWNVKRSQGWDTVPLSEGRKDTLCFCGLWWCACLCLRHSCLHQQLHEDARKRALARQTTERKQRKLNVGVLTVAAYTTPWREHNRSHTTPAPWWASVCDLSRPRRAGLRARTSSRRSLGGTCRSRRERVFKRHTPTPPRDLHKKVPTYTHAGVSSSMRKRQVPWKQKCRWESGHSSKWDQTAAATSSGRFWKRNS